MGCAIVKFFDFGYSCYFDSLFVCGSFCQQLIHKLTGVAIALKTTSVWQNHLGFDHNIEGWTVFGKGAIKERISNAGSRFILLTTEHIHWIVSLRRSNLRKECYTPFLVTSLSLLLSYMTSLSLAFIS